MVIVGIDPSIAGTAICHGSTETDCEVKRFPSKRTGDGIIHRIRRMDRLMQEVDGHIGRINPDVILIEHYSFGSRNGGEYLGEWGGILRWHLIDHTPDVYEVPPASLKKFITGSGGGKKEMMIAHVTKKWDRIFKSNDEVDAFAIYQLGLAVAGVVQPTNKEQRDVVAKVIGDRPLQLTQATAHSGQPPF